MKRFFIAAVAALFAFACAEPKVAVEDKLDEFNTRLLDIVSIIDLEGIGAAGNPTIWYKTLSQEQQMDIAAKCEEFIALQKEMGDWRKSLNQEETERLKAHIKSLNNPLDTRKVNIMNQIMPLARRVK